MLTLISVIWGNQVSLAGGEQPPDGGRKDLTRDYISSANLQERLI